MRYENDINELIHARVDIGSTEDYVWHRSEKATPGISIEEIAPTLLTYLEGHSDWKECSDPRSYKTVYRKKDSNISVSFSRKSSLGNSGTFGFQCEHPAYGNILLPEDLRQEVLSIYKGKKETEVEKTLEPKVSQSLLEENEYKFLDWDDTRMYLTGDDGLDAKSKEVIDRTPGHVDIYNVFSEKKIGQALIKVESDLSEDPVSKVERRPKPKMKLNKGLTDTEVDQFVVNPYSTLQFLGNSTSDPSPRSSESNLENISQMNIDEIQSSYREYILSKDMEDPEPSILDCALDILLKEESKG